MDAWNFSSYLRSLHRADHGVGHLWDFIQNQVPEMSGNTTMIVALSMVEMMIQTVLKILVTWL